MRYVNLLIGLTLLLFAVAQYNDPDGVFWGAAYLLPALIAVAAFVRPAMFGQGVPLLALSAVALASIVAVFWFWPEAPGFWRQDVWWESETAREGMGVMLICLTLLIVLATSIATHLRHR